MDFFHRHQGMKHIKMKHLFLFTDLYCISTATTPACMACGLTHPTTPEVIRGADGS